MMTLRSSLALSALSASILAFAACGDDSSTVSETGGSGEGASGASGNTGAQGGTGPQSASSTVASTGPGAAGGGGSTSNGGGGSGGVGGEQGHGGQGGVPPECTMNAQCDDANACTNDSCDTTAGICLHANKDCNDNNACTNDSCDLANGNCTHENNSNPCDDANACTTGDVCTLGACAGSPVVCNDGNICTTDTCVGGNCQAANVANGTACVVAGQNGTCQAGVCQGGGASCTPDYAIYCGTMDTWATNNVGSTDVVTDYSCNGFDYTGGEYAYTFQAPGNTAVTVTLSGVGVNTDLLILNNNGSCDPSQCNDDVIGGGSTTINVTEGQQFYFVVDSVLDANTPYTIQVTCTENCTDGADNDGNGLVDCEDPQCYNVAATCPACVPQSQPPFSDLLCPSDNDSYNNVGEPDHVSSYSCNPFSYAGAGEYIYTFAATTNGSVTATLSNETVSTDILVLENKGLGCNPASCLGWGFNTITFPVTAGTTYYVVVDGYLGAEGNYSLTFSCQ